MLKKSGLVVHYILLRSQWVKLHVVVVLISILVGETSFNACKLGVPFVRRGHVASYKVSVRIHIALKRYVESKELEIFTILQTQPAKIQT